MIKKLFAPKPKYERKELYTSDEVRDQLEDLWDWRDSTILGWVESRIWLPIYKFFRWRHWKYIRYVFKPANVLHVKRHTRWTAYAKPELLLHANFQILVNFFEEEKLWLENFIKTKWTDEELEEEERKYGKDTRDWCEQQMSVYAELREMYEWYSRTSNDAIQNMLDGFPPDYEFERRKPLPKWDPKWIDEVEGRLRRLVELRGYLWT